MRVVLNSSLPPSSLLFLRLAALGSWRPVAPIQPLLPSHSIEGVVPGALYNLSLPECADEVASGDWASSPSSPSSPPSLHHLLLPAPNAHSVQPSPNGLRRRVHFVPPQVIFAAGKAGALHPLG